VAFVRGQDPRPLTSRAAWDRIPNTRYAVRLPEERARHSVRRNGEIAVNDATVPTIREAQQRSGLDRRSFLQALGVGSLAVVGGGTLAACGSNSPSGAAQSTGGGTPKRGGVLRFASLGGGGSSDTLNPVYAIYDPDLARANQLFDQPVYFNSSGSVEMGLIEELTPNANATTWTARLRSGVTFHDGKPLTADDLVYTFQQIANPKSPGTGAGEISSINIAGLKKLDNLTVQIPCSSPFSILPQVLAGVYYYVIPTNFDPTHPVGTGPFKYDSFTAGGDSYFTRNDSYWQQGLPYLDGIHITDFNDETSMLNALLSGQTNLANLSTLTEAREVQAGGGGYVISKTGSFVPYVMETTQSPFNDVRVRTAMRLIVDRPQFNELVYDGLGAIGNDVFGVTDPYYDHNLPQRVQDIDQAKFLLKQAGATNLHLPLTTGPIGPGAESAAQVFQQQAIAAGVSVSVTNLTSTAFFASTYLHRLFTQDLWFSAPYLAIVGLATSATAEYNETQFHNAQYQKLYEQALALTNDDGGLLSEIVHEMMTIDYDSGGYIIPTFLPEIDVFTKGVAGVKESVLGIPFNQYDFKVLWSD
jgi:peptide/nickel transport system substrate-binding protein